MTQHFPLIEHQLYLADVTASDRGETGAAEQGPSTGMVSVLFLWEVSRIGYHALQGLRARVRSYISITVAAKT